jgi:selenocysteine lyase/cysteine desulfurase
VTRGGTRWNQGAARHEAGSPNVLGAIAIAAACAAIETHRTAIETHEQTLAEQLSAGLAAVKGVTTYSIFGPEHDRVGVSTFTIDGLDSSLVSAVLSAEYGIGVRDGKFCAHLLVDALLGDPCGEDSPGTAVRASIGLASTAEHVSRLLGAIATLAKKGPTFDYRRTATGWTPVTDPRDLTLPRPW